MSAQKSPQGLHRAGVYAQRIVLEACTEDALSTFMAANGTELTSALASYLNGLGRLDVAAHILHSAIAHQTQVARPEVGEDYQTALSETGLTPEANMLRACQQGYTPARHQRYQQRLNLLNAQAAGAAWL